MNKAKWLLLDDHLGCFGSFDIEDPVCKALCAVSLKCCIETEENERMEILEDLVASDDLVTRYH